MSGPARTRAEGAAGSASPAGARMAAEIGEQPAVLAGILSERALVQRIGRDLGGLAPRAVLLAARGTSGHAALFAKYLFETTVGLPVGLASPLSYTTSGATADLAGTIWIAVSQSGASPDLVEATERAGARGARTLALTNTDDSPLAQAAQAHLPLRARRERAVAATKTYTAELLNLWLLVDAWAGGNGRGADEIPDLAAEAVHADVGRLAERLRFAQRVITTGRGFSYPSALEAALKLMETSYLTAQGFSGADLIHGPLAAVDSGTPLIAFASRGEAERRLTRVLERVQAVGADVTVIGGETIRARDDRWIQLPLPAITSLAPIVDIIPAQRLAHLVAVGHGLDPDSPRNLQKVTRTQ